MWTMDLRSTHTYSQPHWFVCGLKWFIVFAMMIPFDLHAMIVIINYILFFIILIGYCILVIFAYCVLVVIGYYRLLLVAMGYHWSLLLLGTHHPVDIDFYWFPAPAATIVDSSTLIFLGLYSQCYPCDTPFWMVFQPSASGYVFNDTWTFGIYLLVIQHRYENGHLQLIYLSKMEIFHSYVSLPEGNMVYFFERGWASPHPCWIPHRGWYPHFLPVHGAPFFQMGWNHQSAICISTSFETTIYDVFNIFNHVLIDDGFAWEVIPFHPLAQWDNP